MRYEVGLPGKRVFSFGRFSLKTAGLITSALIAAASSGGGLIPGLVSDAHAQTSCNGTSGTLTTQIGNTPPITFYVNMDVNNGDVISGSVATFPAGLVGLGNATISLTGFSGSGVTPLSTSITSAGGNYSFTVVENVSGQSRAQLRIVGPGAGITASYSCSGSSSGGGSSGGGSSGPVTTGTPTVQVSIEETKGVVQGRLGISGTDDWLPPTGQGSQWDAFDEDNPDLWTWNGVTGRFNNRNLAAQISRTERQLERALQNYRNLEAEEARLKLELEKLRQEMSANSENLRRLEAERQELRSELQYWKDANWTTPETIQRAREVIGELEGKIAGLGSSIEQRRDELGRQLSAIPDLENQLDANIGNQVSAQSEIKRLRWHLSDLKQHAATIASSGIAQYAAPRSGTGQITTQTRAGAAGLAANRVDPFDLLRLSENSISLSGSLRDLRKRRAAQAQAASRIANAFLDSGQSRYADPGLPGLLGDRRFNAWIDGSFSWTDDDRTGAEARSEAGIIRAGLHYSLTRNVGVGGIVRYAFNESVRTDRSVKTDGNGFGASVYSQIRLPYGAVLSPVFAYERANTDIAIAGGGTTVTGSFETDIFTLGGSLSRRFQFDTGMDNTGFFIDPNLTLSYINAKRRSYVRNDGMVIPGETTEQGSLIFGPTFGMQFLNVSETIALVQPTLGVTGNWNFLRPDSYLSSNNTVVSTPKSFGVITGGLNVALTNGINGQITGTFSGLGSDVTSTTLQGKLSIPF